VRSAFHEIIATEPLQLRYNRLVDILWIYVGRQSRWAKRTEIRGPLFIYWDEDNRPIRIEVQGAAQLFDAELLEQHEWKYHHDQGGRR
jgi:hypothetical protein